MKQLDGKSMDIVSENVTKLKELFPEVFSEAGKIDFKKLEEELGQFTDADVERYNFTWAGKTEAKRIAQTPSTGTLRPNLAESKNWDTTQNLYIEGDNLEVLKLLQKSYHKKIKMIYIDPPYNTGNDFVYPDNFHDNIQNYLEITGQVDSEGKKLSANAETSGRYHSDWLNMMYPRLKLARNLLQDDGVVFISIGSAELSNLTNICNEIFGESNQIAIVGRLAKSGGNKGKFFSPNIEYLLVYAKNIEIATGFRDEMDEELIKKVYTKVQKDGERKGEKYRAMGLYQSSLDPMRGCVNQRYYIQAPDGTLLIPDGDIFPDEKSEGEKIKPQSKKDGVWRWTYSKYQEEYKLGNIEFNETNNNVLVNENGEYSKWNINTKIWLKDRQEEGQLPNDFISKYENRHSAKELKELGIEFDFAKPSELIKYFAIISDVKTNEIVLDFFSGSGTTAHAIMQLNSEDSGNRKFILVQLPEPTEHKDYPTICEIGKERIRRAGEKVKSESGKNDLDIGFKVLKLDSSNIKAWDTDFDNLETNLLDAVDNIKSDRSAEDLLYEVLLKYGLDLTLPIEEKSINGSKIFVIGFGALIVCLDDHIALETVNHIAKLKGEYESEITRVVFKDSSFADAVVKTNALQTLKQFGIDEVVSI